MTLTAKYREHYKKLAIEEKKKLEARYQQAWEIAKKAALILYKKHNAKKVWAFGSLTNKHMFNLWSDKDIAVEGILPEIYYSVAAEIISLSPDFKIDLVDTRDCKSSIREKIAKEGVLI